MLYRVEGTGGHYTVDGLDRLCEAVRLTYGKDAVIEACSSLGIGRVVVGTQTRATVKVSVAGLAQATAAATMAAEGLAMAVERSARVNVRGFAAEA